MKFLFEAALSRINYFWQNPPITCISIGNDSDYVILLHALAKTYHSMHRIEKALNNEGYIVYNLDYPSRKYPIEVLSEKFLTKAINKLCTDKKKKINFVTHSLGGIVVRKYLQDHPQLNIGRVVMIAPPNQGSEIVDCMKSNYFLGRLFTWFFGPAAAQLSSQKKSYVNTELEQIVKYELGIIAGDRCINPTVSFIIKNLNDGRVSIKNTKIQGMSDHIVIHSPHCYINTNSECIKQVSYFLNYGQFYRENNNNN